MNVEEILDQAHKNAGKACYYLVHMLVTRKMNRQKLKTVIELLQLASKQLEELVVLNSVKS